MPNAEPPSSFWDYAFTRRLHADEWGDFIRLIGKGQLERPPEPASIDALRSILNARGVRIDRLKLRYLWGAYERARGDIAQQ